MSLFERLESEQHVRGVEVFLSFELGSYCCLSRAVSLLAQARFFCPGCFSLALSDNCDLLGAIGDHCLPGTHYETQNESHRNSSCGGESKFVSANQFLKS